MNAYTVYDPSVCVCVCVFMCAQACVHAHTHIQHSSYKRIMFAQLHGKSAISHSSLYATSIFWYIYNLANSAERNGHWVYQNNVTTFLKFCTIPKHSNTELGTFTLLFVLLWCDTLF
jgi:hypothetical protein